MQFVGRYTPWNSYVWYEESCSCVNCKCFNEESNYNRQCYQICITILTS
jgi:hypothetical protein